MREFTAFVLLLSLLISAQISTGAQSRARRVGNNPPSSSKTTPGSERTSAEPAPQSPDTVSEEVGDDGVVRVNTTLVTIPVSIVDRDGRFIPNLRKEDFRIFEDGVEQQVAYFATVDQPFTVALVLDTSGSTRFKIEDMQDAAIAFLDELRPADRVLVVSFDGDYRVHAEATNDRYVLRDAIRRTRTGGNTRLYDAVDFVIKQRLNRIDGRKAIVLFTDGVDTDSKRASYDSTVREAEELDASIYPIQYDTYDANQGGGGGWPGAGGGRPSIRIGPITIPIPAPGGGAGGGGGGGGGGRGGGGSSRGEYQRAGAYLRDLAQKSGGRLQQANDVRYLSNAFTTIAEELRRQYSLGYYPKRQTQEAARRQIRVRVNRPNLAVRARDSYIYKPSNGTPQTTAQDSQNTSAPPEIRTRRPFDGSR